MTIEGLGKRFQEARLARGLTLDEAARMTKIRPSRLAEIEAEDFSQFPSLAYAKGFLQIYGKFLDVDVTPYLDRKTGCERAAACAARAGENCGGTFSSGSFCCAGVQRRGVARPTSLTGHEPGCEHCGSSATTVTCTDHSSGCRSFTNPRKTARDPPR